jgi:hypothetical protein
VPQPHGSRIVVSSQAGELSLTIPGAGFRGSALSLFGFACFWLIFVTAWTAGAQYASLLFALFSAPFWLAGIWMMWQALSLIFGVTVLRIGPERYALEKRLWGHVRRYEGLTQSLGGASLAKGSTRINSQRIDHLVLHTGGHDVSFGAQLGLVERRWVVACINQHLGLTEPDADADDDDTDDDGD